MTDKKDYTSLNEAGELQQFVGDEADLVPSTARHFRCILCKQDLISGDPMSKAPQCPRCSSQGTNVGTIVFNCTHPCAPCASVN